MKGKPVTRIHMNNLNIKLPYQAPINVAVYRLRGHFGKFASYYKESLCIRLETVEPFHVL